MKALFPSHLLLLTAGIAAAGCASGQKGAVRTDSADPAAAMPRVERISTPDRGFIIGSEERIRGGAVSVMPKAVAYRMSGDYADRVPVALSADGTLQSYPAPSDLGPGSTPVALADGWWLDRRGVGIGSVFTRYSYPEYEALAEAPSPAQLLDAVIPGARVTAVMQLPVTLQEALADTAAVNAFLRSHEPGLH